MTVLQAICWLIIYICVVIWIYTINQKLKQILFIMTQNVYLSARSMGLKKEDAEEMAILSLKTVLERKKHDGTEIPKGHSEKP